MGSTKSLIPELKSILSLIRFRNIVIGSATVLTGSFVTIQVPWNNELILNVILQMISVSSFMAAGNILNDIMDIEIDKISHPLRTLPAGSIRQQNSASDHPKIKAAFICLPLNPQGTALVFFFILFI